ncbi:uncharacterized protein LOC120212233 [Hibiscus syriacus]|uniref:uncharacterized protein LOC120212233 n=1 Tax=Hibiscus syriacus TaxID=106335 RepID=UPI0019225BDA|nr:uncharacterized protein LOC120212233 [Hibiscus syriacus]
MVADALSRKSMSELRALLECLSLSRYGCLLAELRVELELVGEVKRLQGFDNLLKARIEQVLRDAKLSNKILHEVHCSSFALHSSSNKMHQELLQLYWCQGMKREASEFVSKCLACQQVKEEH